MVQIAPETLEIVGANGAVEFAAGSGECLAKRWGELLEDALTWGGVEIAHDDDLGLWRAGQDGVNRRADGLCGKFAMFVRILYSTRLAGKMAYEEMKGVS